MLFDKVALAASGILQATKVQFVSSNATGLKKEDYEALASLRAAMRRFVRFTEEGARAVGITPQQHQVMLGIKGQPGRDWATVGEIADFLQIKHHTAVGLVDRCEAAGLVARSSDLADRRLVHVVLTERGEELLARFSADNLRELRALRKSLRLSVLDEPHERPAGT